MVVLGGGDVVAMYWYWYWSWEGDPGDAWLGGETTEVTRRIWYVWWSSRIPFYDAWYGLYCRFWIQWTTITGGIETMKAGNGSYPGAVLTQNYRKHRNLDDAKKNKSRIGR